MFLNDKNYELARGKKKLISVLLPSRKRFELLKKTIDSFIKNTSDLSKIEILVRLDYDDAETISKIPELQHDKVDIVVIVGERFGGYKGLHILVNELCAISRGEFNLLFNDDATLESQGWDKIVERYSGKTVVLNPGTRDNADWLNTFPIVSRKIFETLNHYALQTHNDTWIQEISRSIGIEVPANEIYIKHDRYDKTKNNGDEIWDQRTAQWQTCRQQFDEQLYRDKRKEDLFKLIQSLKK